MLYGQIVMVQKYMGTWLLNVSGGSYALFQHYFMHKRAMQVQGDNNKARRSKSLYQISKAIGFPKSIVRNCVNKKEVCKQI